MNQNIAGLHRVKHFLCLLTNFAKFKNDYRIAEIEGYLLPFYEGRAATY